MRPSTDSLYPKHLDIQQQMLIEGMSAPNNTQEPPDRVNIPSMRLYLRGLGLSRISTALAAIEGCGFPVFETSLIIRSRNAEELSSFELCLTFS